MAISSSAGSRPPFRAGRPARLPARRASPFHLPQPTVQPVFLRVALPPPPSLPVRVRRAASHNWGSARAGQSPAPVPSSPFRSCDKQTRRSRTPLLFNNCNMQAHPLVRGGSGDSLDFPEANSFFRLNQHCLFTLRGGPLHAVSDLRHLIVCVGDRRTTPVFTKVDEYSPPIRASQHGDYCGSIAIQRRSVSGCRQ